MCEGHTGIWVTTSTKIPYEVEWLRVTTECKDVVFFFSFLFPYDFCRSFHHVREKEETAGNFRALQLRAPGPHWLRPPGAEVHGAASAVAQFAGGHGQQAEAHGGSLMHHSHPAGSYEGTVQSPLESLKLPLIACHLNEAVPAVCGYCISALPGGRQGWEGAANPST